MLKKEKHISGIAGGSRVLLYEYTGDNITAVSDASGRRVDYTYENGRLKTVTDLRGSVTTYNYTDGKLSRIEEPRGKVRDIVINLYGDVVSVKDDQRSWGDTLLNSPFFSPE